MLSALRKSLASLVAAALILTAPGLPFYQVLAQPEGKGVVIEPGAANGSAPVVNPGTPGGTSVDKAGQGSGNALKSNFSAAVFTPRAFGGAQQQQPNKQLPGQPGNVNGSPLPFTGEGLGERAPSGSADSSSKESVQPEFYQLAGEALNGAPAAKPGVAAPSGSELLAPSDATAADPVASKSWSHRAFSRIFGLDKPVTGPSGAVTATPGLKDPPAGMQPSAYGRSLSGVNRMSEPSQPSPDTRNPTPSSSSNKAWYQAKWVKVSILGGVLMAVSMASPLSAFIASPLAVATNVTGFLTAAASVGYTAGNILAVFFPFGEIFKLYQKREAKNFALSGVLVGFGASMLNFGVAASSMTGAFQVGDLFDTHSIMFWAFQNIFSGIGLLVIAGLANRYAKSPKAAEGPLGGFMDLSPRKLIESRAVRYTLLTFAVLAGLSVIVSVLGATLLPAAVPALNAAAPTLARVIGMAVAALGMVGLRRDLKETQKDWWSIAGYAAVLLGGMGFGMFAHVETFALLGKIVSSLAFLYIVVPDVRMMWKTKDAGSHSLSYHLLLMLASIGLTFWAGEKMVNDADHFGWGVMTAVYFASAVLPGIAIWMMKKFGSKEVSSALSSIPTHQPPTPAGPLPAAVKIEAAASPGVGKKVLEYLDKMDGGVKFLAFDLNSAPFADKLIELHKKGVPIEGYADRRQAFTPTSLVGNLIAAGVPIKTVTGLLTHASGADDEGDDQSILESLPDGTQGRRGIQHIKALIGTDKAGNTYVVMGSANFTRAALGEEGTAANHDMLVFLTYPKGSSEQSLSVVQAKYEKIKAQAADSTQDPVPPPHDPRPGTVTPDQQTKVFRPDEHSPYAPRAPERGLSSSITEDFLGIRHIRGIVHDETLPRSILSRVDPEDAAAVQDQISRQFGISKEEIAALAAKHGLPMGDRAAWLRLYDGLQAMNRQGHDLLDSRKHEGGPSFFTAAFWKDLANGLASDIHKYQLRALFLFPYHLFDMFVFGYFRKAVSFTFLHGHEDFLSIGQPGMPAKALEQLIVSRKAFGTVTMDHVRANRWVRYADAFVYEPVLKPLGQFIFRRATLAIFSAVSMGLVGSLAVFPFMTWSLAAHAPFLLQATAWVGAHTAVVSMVLGSLSAIPAAFSLARGVARGDRKTALGGAVGVGLSLLLISGAGFLGPVFEHALNALIKDMVVGPLLQTAVLSAMLTFPKTLWQARAMDRQARGQVPGAGLGLGRSVRVALQTVVSPRFLKQLGTTFVGMVTVGAEIEGVMTYAGALDTMASNATGAEFHVFEKIGAAVERPGNWTDEHGVKHENLIPFGGAITWGNTLLYKTQTALGLNISDTVLAGALHGLNFFHPTEKSHRLMQLNAQERPAGDSLASRLVHQPAPKAPGDGLSEADRAAVAERLKEAVAKGEASGDTEKFLKKELQSTAEQIGVLKGKLTKDQIALEKLRREHKPLPPGTRERHGQLTRSLDLQRQKLALLDKMAQRGDLLGAGRDPKALAELEALDAKLSGQLPAHTPSNGYRESLQERQASLAALQGALPELDPRTWGKQKDSSVPGTPSRAADDGAIREIKKLLDGGTVDGGDFEKGLFQLQDEAKVQLQAREQSVRTLSAEREMRNHALMARRDGKAMLDFRQNLSKLSMVTELTYQLNKIRSAQKAIKDMEAMIDARIAAIERQQGANGSNSTNANGQLGNIAGWRAEIQRNVDQNNGTAQDFDDMKWEAENAVLRINSFNTNTTALLGTIDAEDKGLSANALAEYARVLNPALIAQIRDNNLHGTGETSVGETQRKLDEVNQKIADAEKGLGDIDAKRFSEAAGLFILLVPGTPAYTGSSPSKDQVVAYIDQRRTYFQAERVKWVDHLSDVNKQLDPSNMAMETDDFGLARPQSKARMLSDWQGKLSTYRGDVRTITSDMDRMAGEIEAIGGGSIPRLGSLGYLELADVLKVYADAFHTVKLPDSVKGYEGKFKMLQLAEALPVLARRTLQWAEADKTVEAVNEGLGVLRLAKQATERLVSLHDSILADGELDRAWINTPLPSDPTQRSAFQNQLIDRKRALLSDTVLPNLRGVRDFLGGTLLPYATKGVLDGGAGHSDNVLTLYEKKKEVYTKIQDALKTTFPWIIAAGGAAEGNKTEAEANIETQIKFYKKYLEVGWDDQFGHHKSIHEYQADVAKRKDPNFTGRDTLYGRDVAYSLPRRITEMSAARDRAFVLLQSKASEIDAIVAQINAKTGNRYHLGTLGGLAQNPDSLKDVIKPYGEQVKAIADEMKAAGGQVTTGPNGEPIPSDTQLVAKMCFDLLERLLPSDLSPNGTSFSENTAEYLWNDGVQKASRDALNDRIPRAEAFLTGAVQVLDDSIADLEVDRAFVRGYPTPSESGVQLLNRKAGAGGILARQASFAATGAAYFRAEAVSEAGSNDTVDKIQQFYQAQTDIAGSGTELANAGVDAMKEIKKGLEDFNKELEGNRHKIEDVYLPQLNDPRFSALHRVTESISEIQKKTEEVLRRKVTFDRAQERHEWANRQLEATLRAYRVRQEKLSEVLKALPRGVTLDPAMLAKVQKVMAAPGAWLIGGSSDPSSALVIRRADWPGFAEKLLTALKPEVDMSSALQELVKDPSRVTQFLAGSKVMKFGDDADGFYLVSQSQFSTPGGIETSSQLTMGNVMSLWGQKLSLTGYHFASPPNEVNAPWGDQGLAVTVESIEGKNWVNYLDVTFHRNLQDIPQDRTTSQQFHQTRMMVFEDFAVLVANDKLYIGLAGFGDWSMTAAKDQPYYYGGNLKTSIQFHEAVKLNAEQQELYAKDPRKFMTTLNLDFTGFDPSLNRDFVIQAQGENKEFHRTQIGPTIDLQKLMKTKDTFDVDVYVANQWGTDDIAQKSVGGSVLKGFSFPLFGQDAKLTSKTGGELGEQYNTVSEKVTLMLPDTGLTISAEGKVMGGTSAHYFEAAYKTSDHSDIKLGYGARYVGQPDRLSVSMQSHYTLAEIFGKAVDEARDRAKGGAVLRGFNDQLDSALDSDDEPAKLKDLKRVFDTDVARQLYQQDIGTLASEIKELQKAGSLFHNTEVRSMIGFVSGPVSDATSDKATTAGWQVGAQTTSTMSKTQKELLEKKIQQVYVTSVKLEQRLIEATRQWQSLAMRIHQAEADAKLAAYLMRNAPDPLVRKEAEVRLAEANARKHQASLEYNTLTGRNPNEPTPFEGLSRRQLVELLSELQRTVRLPGRLTEVFRALSPERLPMTEAGFNVVDYIPLVENIHFMVGTSLQDMMGGQLLGAGVGVKIPLWDANKKANAAYEFENEALVAEMARAYREMDLKTVEERDSALAWAQKAAALDAGQERSGGELVAAFAAYRNGLIPAAKMWEAADRWQWYSQNLIEAKMKAMTSREKHDIDPQNYPRSGPPGAPMSVDDLAKSWERAKSPEHSPTILELQKRAQAASEMQKAVGARINKVSVELNWGTNITSSGIGWLPAFGVTGVSIWPIVDFQLKPAELAALESDQQGARHEYFQTLKLRAESKMALDLYQNYVLLWTSEKQGAIYRDEILPQLQKVYDQAPADGRSRAKEDLDRAKGTLTDIQQRSRDAQRLMNFLLDQPLDTVITPKLDPAQAQAWVEGVITKTQPVALETYLHQKRIDVAMDAHQILGKKLRLEDVKGEPISLVIRSFGRMIDALTADPSASPDLMEAAKQQILEARRGKESFQRTVPVERARLSEAQARVRAQMNDLGQDPVSRLRRLELEQMDRLLTASLKTLAGGETDSVRDSAPRGNGLPGSFTELKSQLIHAEEGRAVRPDPETLADPSPAAMLRHAAEGNHRIFNARTALDGTPINQTYQESWTTIALKDPTVDPEKLRALAAVERDKGDKLYQASLAKARAQAETLAAEFEMYTQLYRASANRKGAATGLGQSDRDAYQRALLERLETLRQEMTARAGLDPAAADLKTLMALVPEGQGSDPLTLSRGFLKQMQSIRADAVAQILFDGLLPQADDTDAKISKLKADMTAQQMSYKGFTPLFAFGNFRGSNVWTGAIEAPNPEQVQAKLADVLGDSLKRAIGSEQRKKELSLQLHSLLRSVDDGTHIVEKRQEMLEAAQNAYAAETQKVANGLGSEMERLKAEENMVRAFSELTNAMVQLRMDFVALVADLQAIGLKDKAGSLLGLSDRAALPSAPSMPDFSRFSLDGPKAMFLDYAAERMADEGYAGALARSAGSADASLAPKIETLLAKAALYRDAVGKAKTVRGADIEETRRIEMLVLIDQEGRRTDVRRALLEVLESPAFLTNGDKAWLEMLGLTTKDLQVQATQAGTDLQDNERVLKNVREAYWNARGGVPMALRGDFQRLEKLWSDRETLRQMLYKEYLASSDGTLDFLVRNLVLDKTLKAQEAYDKEVIALMSDPRVDEEMVRALDTLYGWKDSVARRKDALGHGRGLVALDMLIELSQARLDSLKGGSAGADRVMSAAQRLDQFKGLKDRWSKDASELSAVYGVLALEADGSRKWEAVDWLTSGDYATAHHGPLEPGRAAAARIIKIDDREFFVAKEFAQDPTSAADAARMRATDRATGKEIRVYEVVKGADIRRAAAAESRKALDKNEKERKLAKVFEDSDFALVNGHPEALSRDAFDTMRKSGKLLFFAKEADPSTGLHNAIHPWLAASYSPGSYETLVYLGGGSLSRDRFPYRESIPASDLARSFKTLEIGPRGYEELAKDAQENVLKARRSGYLSLKLTSYGFALDPAGGVAKVYMTSDEFDDAVKEVDEAPKLLVKAEKELKSRKGDLADAQKDLYGRAVEGANEQERALDEARLQKTPLGGRALKVAQLTIQRGNLEIDYKGKKGTDEGEEIERKMSDVGRQLKKAEEKMDEAQKELGDQQSKVASQDMEIARLQEVQRTGPTRRFFLSDKMAWSLDKDGVLVGVDASPVKGTGPLSVALGDGGTQRVEGRIEAVELDKETSRVVRVYSKGELKRESAGWELQDIDHTQHDNKDKTVETRFRIWKYVNPKSGNQVYLNREYLLDRLDATESGLSKAKHFAYLPQNWLNVILQIPRGILQAPEEVLGGVDPEHQGYMGEALMLRGEGGGKPRHGAVMSVIHFLDPFELIPDPAQFYLDPGQFPQMVEIDGPLKPGEGVFQKDPRTLDGDWSVKYGRKEMERQVKHAKEDLEAYRQRPLLEFKGGYQKIVVDERRGAGPVIEFKDGKRVVDGDLRERTYKTSKVATLTGAEGSVQNAAGDAADAALDTGVGLEADADTTPRHLEIDRIHEHMTLWPGAEGYEKQAKDLKDEIAHVEKRLKDAKDNAAGLTQDAETTQKALDKIEADRLELREKVARLEKEVRKLARQIGEHDARQGAIDDLLARIKDLKHRLAMEEAYLKALKDWLRGDRRPPGPKPPTPGNPDQQNPVWKYFALAALFALAAYAIWRMLRRKRDDDEL